jgi:CRP-like cAMP-binding protein
MNSSAFQMTPLSKYRDCPSGLAPIDTVKLLLRADLFRGISSEQCRELAMLAVIRVFQPHESIFVQGQAVTQLLFIESGSVKISQIGTSGKEIIIWIRGSGEMLGDTSVLTEARHTCSATAIHKCKALAWDTSVFRPQVGPIPTITNNVALILSSRLHDLESRFVDIATTRVSHRIATAVFRAAKMLGRFTSKGLEVRLSQKELSQMCGTDVFSISRRMVKWDALGIVSVGVRSFVVLDMERLRAATEDLDE